MEELKAPAFKAPAVAAETRASRPPAPDALTSQIPATSTPPSPAQVSVPPDTGMGAVHLDVTNGDRALAFWRDYVGLSLLPSERDAIRMGAGGRALVVLHPGATGGVVPGRTGLYHLALLVPDRRELARVIARLGALGWQHYPTDHIMTKSDYLSDPDGNGIEIYTESPEDGTLGFGDGTFFAMDKFGNRRSGVEPMDIQEMLIHLQPDDDLKAPMPAGTKMGHVHLHIAEVEAALRFYHDLIGFDVMGNVPTVAFVSAGGYHHHIGLNTWAGAGAPPRPAGAAGLRLLTIELPTRRDLDDVIARLRAGGVEVKEVDGGFEARDPSSNAVRLVVRPGAA